MIRLPLRPNATTGMTTLTKVCRLGFVCVVSFVVPFPQKERGS
ncbi:MAG TPA: hypothetical protein VM370_12790 [Candidatus Thermoplasmatota archaeon]|nr:hypothetical protein [Candidatus Thermoplasmatota archaeon]